MTGNNSEYEVKCGCEDRVNHIKCEVSNCFYHGDKDTCHASMIEVTPSYATTENDTACSTFQAQSQD